MTYDEAVVVLLRHGSGLHPDEENPDAIEDGGFLGMLRPYRGLNEEHFHTVMEALLAVGVELHTADQVDRELIECLWSMARLMRLWGLHPDGMLQRNNLITEVDIARLAKWVEIFESSALTLLGGCPPSGVVEGYAEYIVDVGPGPNIEAFLPHLQRCLEEASDPSGVAEAIGRLGPIARPILPALRAAAERTYADWCREDAQQQITRAIAAVEA